MPQDGRLPSWRTDRRKTAERGYGGRWQRQRRMFLFKNPLCEFCKARGIIKEANVVDHKTPHKGDEFLFWDYSNWQALCENCHNGVKQRIEKSGVQIQEIGLDGWPK